MEAKAPYTHLSWDSAHFGVSIARMDSSRLTEPAVGNILHWLNIHPVDCLYLLAEPEPQTMRLAARCGFRFVDSRVTLQAQTGENSFAKSPRIRCALAGDIPALRQIAGQSHHNTRFYADGNFTTSACDELYRKWIEKAINDQDTAVFIAVPEGQPAGYISCGVTNGKGQIGLLAVDAGWRGRGLGSELIWQAIGWTSSRGAAFVKAATQGLNVPSLRLYEKCGFSISSVELWYHRWEARFG